jgi:hypothetical protein
MRNRRNFSNKFWPEGDEENQKFKGTSFIFISTLAGLKGFRSASLNCFIAPNSAPSPALRKPFSLALATKRMTRGTLKGLDAS